MFFISICSECRALGSVRNCNGCRYNPKKEVLSPVTVNIINDYREHIKILKEQIKSLEDQRDGLLNILKIEKEV